MIVITGVLIALAGLVLVGTGGGSTRRRRNYRLPIGLFVIAAGALLAILGDQIMLIMGYAHP